MAILHSETLVALPTELARVRAVVGRAAVSIGGSASVVADAKLAVTEACANVIRHAYAWKPGPLELCIRTDGPMLRIIVTDHGRGFAETSDGGGDGRVRLIRRLCDGCVVHRRAGGGTAVEMSFRVRPLAG